MSLGYIVNSVDRFIGKQAAKLNKKLQYNKINSYAAAKTSYVMSGAVFLAPLAVGDFSTPFMALFGGKAVMNFDNPLITKSKYFRLSSTILGGSTGIGGIATIVAGAITGDKDMLDTGIYLTSVGGGFFLNGLGDYMVVQQFPGLPEGIKPHLKNSRLRDAIKADLDTLTSKHLYNNTTNK